MAAPAKKRFIYEFREREAVPEAVIPAKAGIQ